MATIAMAAAFSSQGGMTYAIMTTIGSIIDQQIILPALFPADPIEGHRLGEIQIMGADDGSPMPMCYGQEAKVSGMLFWKGDLEEVEAIERQGKNRTKVTYKYYADCAIAITRVKAGRTLTQVREVYADQKRVFDYTRGLPEDDFQGTGLFMHRTGNNPNNHRFYLCMDESVNASVMEVFNNFFVGDKVTFTLWSNPLNNDTNDEIIWKGQINIGWDTGSSSGTETFPALRMTKEKVNEDTGSQTTSGGLGGLTSDRRITQRVINDWSNSIQEGGWASRPDIFLGNNSDYFERMERTEVTADTPYHINLAYVGFDSLNLEDFGFRIPNFEFIVDASVGGSATPHTMYMLESILLDAGIPAGMFDVTALSGLEEEFGITLRGPTEVSKLIQPILLFDNIITQERGGTVYFLERKDAIENTILDNDIGVSTGKPTGGVEIQQTPHTEKLGEVTVSFIDKDTANYKTGTERAHAFTHNVTGSELNQRNTPERWTKFQVNLPITTTKTRARELAHRVLWSTWADDLHFSMTLPPKYAFLQENDRIVFDIEGITYKALINKIDFGHNLIIKVEASLDNAVDHPTVTDWPE